MNKKQIITILRQAKPDHMRWVKQAGELMGGQTQSKIERPINHKECLFGRWYKKEGCKLINIPELKEAEKLHQEVHNIYIALYYITFERRKKARSTVMSAGLEIPINEKLFRDKKFKQLKKKAIKLVHTLERVEKKVVAMSTQDFTSPWLS